MKASTKYSPFATRQLQDLYEYVARASGPERADAFVGSIFDYCDRLANSPYRGTKRDDLRPGLRIVGLKRQVTIAFSVTDGAVEVLGVFYRGRSFESVLRDK
ncbi:MAG: type II toxin-antitoxin system RelE/ParE family toxin [Rhodospirillales bacterium]|nr:type II toxin-antitoxin system RelE/ParE family toxin [Rhodospirillales bacterium]